MKLNDENEEKEDVEQDTLLSVETSRDDYDKWMASIMDDLDGTDDMIWGDL